MMSAQVLPFVQRVVNPNWMPMPDRWVWPTAQGMMQGFGYTWRNCVGLANLQWLVLDMENPPRCFNVRQHNPYMLVTIYGAPHNGVLSELVQLAELNSLPRFRAQLAAKPEIANVPRFQLAPLLLMLADKRIRNANPG